MQVQAVLKKAAGLDIQMILPLHGPVWRKDIAWFIDKYQKWSTYEPETDDTIIVYGSLYGHTASAAMALASKLRDKTGKNIKVYDVSGVDVSYLIGEVWRCSKIVLMCPTYNNGIYPPMESFLADMKQAGDNGWNLITEKYARMEESTAPDHYAQIADKLPDKDDKTKAIVEEIVKIQVGFMEDFAEDYPKVAGTARKIHTYEDTPFDTSYETYLRGELLTYSPKTLELYGRYVVDHVNKENNIAKEIMTNTALLYGYRSLEDLESKLD